MKTNYLLLLLFAFSCNAFATDTTTVRIHDHTDMTWYGNYDEWGVLPSTDNNYRKVYLHYTMGCATGGCSDWDYTTQIFVRHRTGEVDSTLQESPNFTVNGTTEDSLLFSDSTFVHFWNTSTQSVDSTLSNTYEIAQYNDPTNPTVATDTLIKYESEFYNMVFDTVGSVIDSFYVASTDTLVLDYYNWHTVFDVIENYELARVITPYGNGLSNNWEFTTTFDVTDFASILSDSVEIRCHYSGWSSGFSASLDFEFIEGTPARDVVKVENIYSGGYNYNSSTDFEANQLTPQNFLIDPSTTSAMVKMSSTGHGFDNNQSAAEFKPINYYLKVDGVQTHTQYNWDNKCGENPIYPQGGTWIYDRANWCPGTRSQIFDHEITPYISSGDSVEINVDYQSYSWSGTQTPSYIVESQLIQYKNPNFENSAEIIDIIKPSLKDEHSRKNPICGKPLIVIK
ncbi:MAG: peptide-N-glycosidase F-related protein, partial [Methylophagaceae bacterium]